MKIAARISLFFCFLILAAIQVYAEVQNPEQLFGQANADYRNGRYQEAFASYEKLAAQKSHPDIYYDLGNAAFKNKQLGLAIAYYERARKLNPRDPDILENLKLAKSLVEYRVEDKRSWYRQKTTELLDAVRFHELLAVSLSVYLILVVLVFARITSKQRPVLTEFSTYILWFFIVVSIPTAAKFYQNQFQSKAVVTKSQVDARFAPSEKDKVAFRLVEGISVTVADKVDDWYRISLVNGDTGWVQKDEIVMV